MCPSQYLNLSISIQYSTPKRFYQVILPAKTYFLQSNHQMTIVKVNAPPQNGSGAFSLTNPAGAFSLTNVS